MPWRPRRIFYSLKSIVRPSLKPIIQLIWRHYMTLRDYDQKTYIQKSCTGKIPYNTYCAAQQQADSYNETIALVEHPMVVYPCSFPSEHKNLCESGDHTTTYHCGHDRFMDVTEETNFLKHSRSRARLRINQFKPRFSEPF